MRQAAHLSGASKVMLTRQEPASRDLRVLHSVGFSERVRQARFVVGEGMIGRVAASRAPYASQEVDRAKFLSWVIEEEDIGSFAHVPLSIGARLFGVLTVADERPGLCDDALLARMEAFGLAAAGAIANALDFARERRVALALTRGFVPGPLPELEGFDAGLVFEPSGHAAGGGDFFGIWRLPNGSVALLVGDVSGKGIEVAAISSMVRFFVEARTYDAADPAEVMSQTNALLRGRLPGITFVPAVMMVIDEHGIRWCNAGHTPPLLIAAGGRRARAARHGPAAGARGGRGRTPPRRRRSDPATSCSRAPTGSPRRAARAASSATSGSAGLLADARARAGRREPRAAAAPRGGGVGARARRRRRHPRPAAAAMIETRHEAPDGPAAQALWDEYMALVRERAGPDFEPTEHIFATVDVFRGPNGRLDRALRRATRRWPAPGCASSSPGSPRSSACS